MIILRPFTYRDPRVDALLQLAVQEVPGAEVVDVFTPVEQVTAYHDLVCAWWQLCPADEDLVIIEQDVAITPNVLAEFAACDQPWCGFPTNAAGTVLVTTGCVKFSPQLRRDEPEAANLSRRIGPVQDGLAAGHWARIDVRLFGVLRGMKYAPHEHRPEVAHLRDDTINRLRELTGRSE